MKYSRKALILTLTMVSSSVLAADYEMTINAGFLDSSREILAQERVGTLAIHSSSTLKVKAV